MDAAAAAAEPAPSAPSFQAGTQGGADQPAGVPGEAQPHGYGARDAAAAEAADGGDDEPAVLLLQGVGALLLEEVAPGDDGGGGAVAATEAAAAPAPRCSPRAQPGTQGCRVASAAPAGSAGSGARQPNKGQTNNSARGVEKGAAPRASPPRKPTFSAPPKSLEGRVRVPLLPLCARAAQAHGPKRAAWRSAPPTSHVRAHPPAAAVHARPTQPRPVQRADYSHSQARVRQILRDNETLVRRLGAIARGGGRLDAESEQHDRVGGQACVCGGACLCVGGGAGRSTGALGAGRVCAGRRRG